MLSYLTNDITEIENHHRTDGRPPLTIFQPYDLVEYQNEGYDDDPDRPKDRDAVVVRLTPATPPAAEGLRRRRYRR